jgi:methylamine dehydrogenase heavy chain
MQRPARAILGLLAPVLLLTAQLARAADPVGAVVSLPAEPGPHWIWASDVLLRRAALIDGDTGRFLGQIPAGVGIIAPHRSRDGREIYQAETHYSRGSRGERTDRISISDAITLAPLGEIVIPPKRSEHTSWIGGSALGDDGRFLAVFNLTPTTSLSIVDVAERRFVGEVETPGCSLVYAAGPRRFLSLCADGTALVLSLDESGGVAAREKTQRFFDPLADPIMEKPVRRGGEWIFVSFAGVAHGIDVSGPALRFAETWSLVDEAERAAEWRVGGPQNLAIHAPSGRLYALMNQAGPDSHKHPGKVVWVFDLAQRKRVQTIELRSPIATLLMDQTKTQPGGALDWLFQMALPNDGMERIVVTQDAAPLLFAASGFPAALQVYDATTGAHLRDVSEVGVATALIQLP